MNFKVENNKLYFFGNEKKNKNCKHKFHFKNRRFLKFYLKKNKVEVCVPILYYIYIRETKNNIFLTLVDCFGFVKGQVSGGTGTRKDLKGMSRNTPVAAARASNRIKYFLEKNGCKRVGVRILGNKDNLVDVVLENLKENTSIKYVSFEFSTRLAHNGVRNKRSRRL